MLKPHEQPPKIATVFFDPVVQPLHGRLLQVADHFFPELAAAFAGYDLQEGNSPVHTVVQGISQRPVDFSALVEEVVQVQFMLCHGQTRTSAFSASHRPSFCVQRNTGAGPSGMGACAGNAD